MLTLQGQEDAAGKAAQMEAALKKYPQDIEENTRKVETLKAMEALQGMGVANPTPEQIQGVISSMTPDQKKQIRDEVTKAVDAEYAKNPQWSTIQGLDQLRQGVQSGALSFQGFCQQLPGISESQAKQMADLWTIYSAGGPQTSTPAPEPKPDPTPTPQEG